MHTDFFAHRCLYTQRFLRKNKCTQKFLHTDALHEDVFVRINKGTHVFFTQNLFHRETFAQNCFYAKIFFALKNFDVEKNAHKLHKKFLHTDFFARRNFTQNSFFT